jgi:hypothetical protein
VTASSLSFREKALIQTLSKAFWHFDELFVAQQLNNVPHPVVDGGAVAAAGEVTFNLESHLRCEIAFQVIRQLPADLLAVDFYNARLL